jgi:hypothetical protein
MWFLLLLSFAQAAPENKLEYVHGQTHYSISQTSAAIVLRENGATFRIARNKCNEAMLNSFDSEFRSNFKRLPEVRGRGIASVKHVTFDSESRLLGMNPLDRRADEYFATLPKAFRILYVSETAKCSR